MSDRPEHVAAWTDARLADAFGARAATHPTPAGLADAAIQRIHGDAPRSTTHRGFRLLVPVVAAAALAVVVGAIAFVRPAVAPGSDPATAFGLPILTIAEAIAVRDTDPTDRELAVRGHFSPAPAGIRCPAKTSAAESPVRLECPFEFQWLLDTAAPLGNLQSSLPPGRVGLQPLLPFLDTTTLDAAAAQAQARGSLVEVVLIGHFHDRRGEPALCDVPDPAACAGFIADSIYSIAGARADTSVIVDMEPWQGEQRPTPKWTPADVRRTLLAAAPRVEILSIVGLPGNRIRQVEPALGTGALGIIDRAVVWVVTALDQGTAGATPVRRTFLIVDGTNEAYESVPFASVNVGFVAFRLVGPPRTSDEPSPDPTTAPSSAAAFPAQVLGLNVIDVADSLVRQPAFGDEELAIRGWYVGPDPAADCPGLRDPIRPVRPPICAEGQHWLLERPEQLWSDPGKVGIDRQPTDASLNPIIPSDVPFEVPNLWSDSTPDPLPVVVVGHFSDARVTETYAGNQYFVVDQLVWQAGAGMVSNGVVRLVDVPVESSAAVMSRIDRAVGPIGVNWVSIVRGSDLPVLDSDAAQKAPELTRAPAVWVVRRLVDETVDGVTRPVVATAMTVDGGTRVWDRRGCCRLNLETTVDVVLPTIATGRGVVEITDRTETVLTARAASPGDYRGWKPVGPKEGWWLEVAAGRTPQELAIRWMGDRCKTTWSLTVDAGPWLDLSRPFVDGCSVTNGIPRAIVLTFDRPIDIDQVTANDNTSGG